MNLSLTPRERRVLRLLAFGERNQDIGDRIRNSRFAVANIVKGILDKTGMSNRAELALWYWKHNPRELILSVGIEKDMKIFPFVSQELYAAQVGTIRNRELEIARLEEDLRTMRASLLGSDIDHGKDLLKLRDQLLAAERTAASSVAMTAEKQKEIASLRGQINEILAAHKEEVALLNGRIEKFVDWMAAGGPGVPVFAKREEVIEPPVAPAAENPDPIVPTDMQEALRIHGPRARNVIRHLTQKADEKFNDEQIAVRQTFQEDRASGEATAVAAKSA